METPAFSSLEEAWVDLLEGLDPAYATMIGSDLREFFFAGAVAAIALIRNGQEIALTRDLHQNIFRLKKEMGQ